MTKSEVMVSLGGHQAIIIKETLRMTREMGMERCTGMMEVFIKDNGKMEFNTALEQ